MNPMDLGRAVDKARAKMSQTELGNAIGVSQPVISEIIAGKQNLSVLQMAAIERATGRPPGYILRAAGYLVDLDTAGAIRSDPNIDDGARRTVLGAYENALIVAARAPPARQRSAERSSVTSASSSATRSTNCSRSCIPALQSSKLFPPSTYPTPAS